MWNYIQTTIAEPPVPTLSTLQVLWQETPASVIIGELHGSTLLDDESRSNLNHLFLERAESKMVNLSKANFVEINNVCNGGNEIKAFLDNL